MTDQPFSDAALKELRITAPAPPDEVMAARRMLNAAIEREKAGAGRRWSLRPWLVAAASSAAAVVAVVAVAFTLSVVQAPSVSASLESLSEVAAVQPELFAAPGTFVYSASEGDFVAGDALPVGDADEVSWVQPVQRELWQAEDGSVFLRQTFGQPAFFDPATEAAFEAAGYRDLHPEFGATVESTGSDGNVFEPSAFPTEPAALEAAMLTTASQAGLTKDAVGLVGIAAELLVETETTPELRAAILTVLARTDGIELVERDDDFVEVAATGPSETVSLVFDPGTAHIIAITETIDSPPAGSGIPAGTRTELRYEAPRVVEVGPFGE